MCMYVRMYVFGVVKIVVQTNSKLIDKSEQLKFKLVFVP